MEKFVVLGHHPQHPTRKFELNLPKAKHFALVAVKDGEKIIDTKRVIEHAVYKSSMSLQHQVLHTLPYIQKPCEKIQYLYHSLQSIFLKQPFPLNQGPVILPFECEGRVFYTRCRFCRHQMRVLYEALSKEIMNSADYKKNY